MELSWWKISRTDIYAEAWRLRSIGTAPDDDDDSAYVPSVGVGRQSSPLFSIMDVITKRKKKDFFQEEIETPLMSDSMVKTLCIHFLLRLHFSHQHTQPHKNNLAIINGYQCVRSFQQRKTQQQYAILTAHLGKWQFWYLLSKYCELPCFSPSRQRRISRPPNKTTDLIWYTGYIHPYLEAKLFTLNSFKKKKKSVTFTDNSDSSWHVL